jgi:hypothetical protein
VVKGSACSSNGCNGPVAATRCTAGFCAAFTTDKKKELFGVIPAEQGGGLGDGPRC